MASLQSNQAGHYQKKPWRARVKIDWQEYFLGCFETKAEAEDVEQNFRRMAQQGSMPRDGSRAILPK